MAPERWESAADLHARLRWVGIVLFLIAGVALGLNLGAALAGHGPYGRAFVALFALGMSLGSFGANSDTALHAMRQLHREGRLPARHAAEWAHELDARPRHARDAHAAPRMAMVLPMVAILAVGWSLWRGLGAWGLI